MRTGTRLLCLALGLATFSTPVFADPFPTRDQNPLLAGYGIPMPMPARVAPSGQWRFAADLNWGSTAVEQAGASEALLVDAETRELRLTVGRGFGDRWMVQLQLPYRDTDAGDLDGFIDGWHDFFGLPDGARSDMPRDRFLIAYERNSRTVFERQASVQGFADASADLGYRLLANERTAISAWLNLKLPTGDADELTGSGATDIGLTLAGEHRFGQSWSAYGQVAVTWLGEGDLLSYAQRSVVWSALAGVDVNLWRGLDAKLQFDAHSAVFDDSALDFLGDALVLTIGGAYRFQSGWTLDAGVSEDIRVDASPDVVFVLGLRRTF